MATPSTAPSPRAFSTLLGRDFLSIRDLSSEELSSLLSLAADVKRQPARFATALGGRVVALLFEKPSLRTRVSFDVASHQLGGHAIYLAPQEVGLGKRETIPDVAHTLEHMVHAVVARVFSQASLEELAAAASVPVVNALSDFSHPCQALADYLTISETKGALRGLRVAYIGDGNNVAHSLVFAGALLGVDIVVATPPSHEPAPEVVAWARAHAAPPAGAVHLTHDPVEAARGADVIYTDTWISMGQEAESDARRREFAGFEVTEPLFAAAKRDAIFMHCLPAHRGEEVEARVIEGPRSVVFAQAENRLHTEKALLVALLGRESVE